MSLLRSALASLFLLAVSGAAAQAQDSLCEPGKAAQKYPAHAGTVVKIAATPVSPPFSYADPADPDHMVGLEVEMITKAMACAGLRYEFVRGPWSALLSSLLSGAGSTDVMISNVNYRPDRAQRADYVLYMRVGESVIVLKGNPKRLAALDSLCGATGSSTVGGASWLLIERQTKACTEGRAPAIDYMPAVDAEAAYRQLANRRVDFVMDDTVQAAARVAVQTEFEVASDVVTDALSGIVVRKGDAEMLRIVSDGLKAQERDGVIRDLAGKYGLAPNLLIPVEVRN